MKYTKNMFYKCTDAIFLNKTLLFLPKCKQNCFDDQVKTSYLALSLPNRAAFICRHLQASQAQKSVTFDLDKKSSVLCQIIRACVVRVTHHSLHSLSTFQGLEQRHGTSHQQTSPKSIGRFQTTASVKLGGGVQTATIRVPSEEGSSFQCHFYILSHSLSPVHGDS